MKEKITITNAHEHNLKNISLCLPLRTLCVITGLSGSGKSSLAFDTIFKEGQRRYIASLNAYARQFMHQMDRPKVDHIDGLQPAISITQKSAGTNPRSTVGTITELYDFLRLLYSRLGTPVCPKGHGPISGQSPGMIISRIEEIYSDKNVYIMAPMIIERKGEYKKELKEYRESGFLRVRIDDKIYRLDKKINLARYEKHTIEIICDRIKITPDTKTRLEESVYKATELSEGKISVTAVNPETDEDLNDTDTSYRLFSTVHACAVCGYSVPEMEPALFSFNIPTGACKTCGGLGYNQSFSSALMTGDAEKSIFEGALNILNKDGNLLYLSEGSREIKNLYKIYGFDLKTPWNELPENFHRRFFYGSDDENHDKVDFAVIPRLNWLYDTYNITSLERYMIRKTCPACNGSRLNPVGSAVIFNGMTIYAMTQKNVQELFSIIKKTKFSKEQSPVGEPIRKEILERLDFLNQVGLHYLTLDRRANTLSGGESQRIRLAAQIGSGLEGCLYILDEPSIGLHQRDNKKLLKTLQKLRDKSNTVIVIEHDEETMLSADHIIDIGPGAGTYGGKVCFNGTPLKMLKRSGKKAHHTRDFLIGRKTMPLPETKRPAREFFVIKNPAKHNLKQMDVKIPQGVFTCVTGVSGSGKSTLIIDILADALKKQERKNAFTDGIAGVPENTKVVEIDQSPIGRTPRSNPATYTKAMDIIRDLFASVPESRIRGYTKSRFSFNIKGGRCEHCGGTGTITSYNQLFSKTETLCEICEGKRFNRNTLDIHYKGKTIYDVLEMSIEEAEDFFKKIPALNTILAMLNNLGMGYIKLGQRSTTLSGGEAQRMKLVSELAKNPSSNMIYILDEPTTGLHFEDILKLLKAVGELVDRGHSVIMIEHNLDVIQAADYLIEMGPEGGDQGGFLIAEGTPQQLADLKTPTAVELKKHLKKQKARQKGVFIEEPEKLWGLTRKDTNTVLTENRNTSPILKKTQNNNDVLKIEGITKNNLKNINVLIPKNQIIAITGVSGSGKSSLAFDTIYREGQRKYLESLSTYARRFLGRLPRAEAEKISGISPTIAVDQSYSSQNPRSTVATQTELYDSLRVLFANAATMFCPKCGKKLQRFTPSLAARDMTKVFSGKKVLIKAPLWEKSSERKYLLQKPEDIKRIIPILIEKGHPRIEIDGKILKTDEINFNKKGVISLKQSAFLIIDRVHVNHKKSARLEEAVEKAYENGENTVVITDQENKNEKRYAPFYACFDDNIFFEEELKPRHYSFNHYSGACPHCNGLGEARQFSEEKFITDPSKPLLKGAIRKDISLFFTRRGQFYGSRLKKEARRNSIDLFDTPWDMTKEEDRRYILYGKNHDASNHDKTWKGISYIIEDLYGRSSSDRWRTAFEKSLDVSTCPVCLGSRLKPIIAHASVAEKTIGGVTEMSVTEADRFFSNIEKKLSAETAAANRDTLTEIQFRIKQMLRLGLYYLTLDRKTGTLSGGESQRIRLSTQIGNKLKDVIYILDEPTIGLHEHDTLNLLTGLRELKKSGNTVIVVEHDRQMIQNADYIIDIGPGAGEKGGYINYSGPFKISRMKNSSVYPFMKSLRTKPLVRNKHQTDTLKTKLHFKGADKHNLKSINGTIPLGQMTVITGVSGSGKSSLFEWLIPRIRKFINYYRIPKEHLKKEIFFTRGKKLIDIVPFEKIITVDQTPLSANKRSTPVSYMKILDPIRKIFAQSPDAKKQGFTAGHFSFNSAKGRCPVCCGRGEEEIEMHFISDVTIPCPECGGKRYKQPVLKTYYKGKNIADIMEMTFHEAYDFFYAFSKIREKISYVIDTGLGYLKLGMKTGVLSGGERQRLKIATEIAGTYSQSAGNLYILDEPTTGLHFADIKNLMKSLDRLTQGGSTILTIEHNTDFIKNCDHVIDLGPLGGEDGGKVVFEGTPEDLSNYPDSLTGKYI